MNMATAADFVDQNQNQQQSLSQIKLRPSSTMYSIKPHHIMPAPTRTPWNACNMPWSSSNATYSDVMEFNGQPIAHCSQTNPNSIKNILKRKSLGIEPPINVKKHINEEKMAEYLNSLHISNDYTSHYQETPSTSSTTASCNNTRMDGMSMESDNYYNINMSPQELEQKLKNAQRITVCEEIRELENESIIPKSLLKRMERPCTALVLWQPPKNLSNLIIPLSRQKDDEDDDDDGYGKNDNNNSSLVDLNNSSMDMDL